MNKQENMNAKYIRTQAGVYEIKNGKFMENFDVEKYSKDFPVRFADTIEELCDEFVQEELLYEGDYKHYILPKCENKPIKTVMRGIKQHLKDGDIYGAIWTEQGLIYIAKMNYNGELDLL